MRIKYFIFLCLYFLMSHAYAQKTDLDRGIAAFNTKDYKTTLTLLTPIAAKGNCAAEYAVGYCYVHDYDIKNDSLAIHWLQLAAGQKHLKAMGALAECYYWDNKMPDHLARAYFWGMLASIFDPEQEINTVTLLAKAYMKPDELDRADKLIGQYEERWHGKPVCR